MTVCRQPGSVALLCRPQKKNGRRVFQPAFFLLLAVFVRFLVFGPVKWVCNFCKREGPVPQNYQCPLDAMGLRRDREQRAELCRGSVDFVVPQACCVTYTKCNPSALRPCM